MAGAQTNAPEREIRELQIILATLRAENEKQRSVIRDLQTALAASRAENQSLRQQVEADRRVPTLDASATVANRDNLVPAGGLSAAKIVDVNSQLHAVVLGVGAQQGVRVGMPFLVLRGDRVVAEVRVVEVRTRVSGALIENADKGVTLRAGDGAQVTQTTGAELRKARPGSEKEILWKSKR